MSARPKKPDAADLQKNGKLGDAFAGAVEIGTAPLRDLIVRPTVASLRAVPPRRRYLLTTPKDGAGVFVAGEVGVLAAPGGTGKSYALMQLAVAVATGTTLFGEGRGWKAECGRVLYVPGEEDREEAERRLYYAVRASGIINPEDLQLLAGNLDLLPLRGKPAALTTALDPALAALPETQRCAELRAVAAGAVAAGRPYSLIILDPLSRFAGTDVETDNAAATRFVQVLESLTGAECGGPSLLVSAHERKRQLNDNADSADPIRGSSALKDAFRWAARLEQLKRKDGAPDLLGLRTVKTNNVKPGLRLDLCRAQELHGALRVATDDELAAYQQSVKSRASGGAEPEDRATDLAGQILAELAKSPASGTRLAAKLHVHKAAATGACDQLEEDGRIERKGKKWVLNERTDSTGSIGAGAARKGGAAPEPIEGTAEPVEPMEPVEPIRRRTSLRAGS